MATGHGATDPTAAGWTEWVQMGGWTDGRTDGRTNGWMDGWTDGRRDGWMDADGHVDRFRLNDGWIDWFRWLPMDGRINRLTNGWMDW